MNWRSPAGAVLAVMAVAALALGAWIEKLLPSPSDVLDRPFERSAAVNEVVELRTAKLVATRVRTAESVEDELGEVYRTTGVFVVVDLQYKPLEDPQGLRSLRVVTASGTVHGLSVTGDYCLVAQTGVTMACTIAVELPADELVRASLLVPTAGDPDSTGDDVAVIDLGITEGSALVTAPEASISLTTGTYWEAS